jgi:hypothetical protein
LLAQLLAQVVDFPLPCLVFFLRLVRLLLEAGGQGAHFLRVADVIVAALRQRRQVVAVVVPGGHVRAAAEVHADAGNAQHGEQEQGEDNLGHAHG